MAGCRPPLLAREIPCKLYICIYIYVVGQIDPSGQFVSTQVSLEEVQSTGHRSLFYKYRKYPKHSLELTLGLILALVDG